MRKIKGSVTLFMAMIFLLVITVVVEEGEIGLSDDELLFRGGNYRIHLRHNHFFFRTKIMNYSINSGFYFLKEKIKKLLFRSLTDISKII